MLVYLAACGMGLGHASRLLSVAKKLRTAGIEVVFSSYGRAVEMVELYGFRCLRTREVRYEVDEYGEVDVRRTLAKGPSNLYRFIRQVGDEMYYIGTIKPDIVVSDSRLSSLIAARVRNIPSLLILSQLRVLIPVKKPTRRKLRAKSWAEETLYRLLGKCWSLADEILVPDYPPPYTIAKANLIEEGEEPPPRVSFIGPLLPAWPEDLPSKEEAREELGISGKLIVASFTGLSAEGRAVMESFMKELRLCKLPEDVTLIVSRGIPTSSPSIEKVGRNVYVYDWLENRYLYVKAADALITHGGHTSVLEAIAFGLPALHVVKRTHTERLGNAQSAESLGVAKVHLVGESSSLCEKLEWLLSDDALEGARKVAKELSVFRGDKAVIDRIFTIVKAA